MDLTAIRRFPSARLIRARDLASNGGEISPRSGEDRAVLSYAKYLRDLKILDSKELGRYQRMRPVLSELHFLVSSDALMSSILNRPHIEDFAAQKDRAIIKALILGGVDLESVSDLVDYPQSTLEMFEYIAWDVRSRRHKKAWVHNYVFGQNIYAPTDPNDFERLCLLWVYKHGPQSLMEHLFLGDFDQKILLQSMRDQNALDEAAKAGVMINSMPVNSFTSQHFHNTYNQHESSDRNLAVREGQASTSNKGDEVAEGLITAVQDAGLSIASPTRDAEDKSKIESAEPRAKIAFEKALTEVMNEAGIEVAQA